MNFLNATFYIKKVFLLVSIGKKSFHSLTLSLIINAQVNFTTTTTTTYSTTSFNLLEHFLGNFFCSFLVYYYIIKILYLQRFEFVIIDYYIEYSIE
jgi:hypothetical protein